MWQNSKTQSLTKFKNSNCDKTQQHKLWQNSKIQIVTILKTLILTILKTPNVTKLKNSNCDKIKKNKIMSKFINSNYDKNHQLKLWQKSKNQILEKLKNQILTAVIVEVVTLVVIVTYFRKNNSTPWQPMRCSQGSFSQFSRYLKNIYI